MIDGIPNRPLYFYQKDIIAWEYDGNIDDPHLLAWSDGMISVEGMVSIPWFDPSRS